MPNIITRGAMSAKALGFTGQTVTPVYVEDVFSTYLYTGNGSAQTITNNIDLSTKGGMVWTKSRSNSEDNNIVDTSRGGDNMLYTNQAIAQFSLSGLGFSPFSFLSNGYSYSNASINAQNLYTFASWTFRKQPKFFDVVSYTGTGSATTIAHNLGCAPGMIIVKRTDATQDWQVWQRDLGAGTNGQYNLRLNTTDAKVDSGNFPSAPTSTSFSVGIYAGTNASGGTYVAYLFADSNSGGFGLSGTDSVVACGSFTSGSFVNLGWEPQFILSKLSTGAQAWLMTDSMRGLPVTNNITYLSPNSSAAEVSGAGASYNPSATGFTPTGFSPGTHIYLAIRRGPMKTPTDATKVFSPITSSAATGTLQTTGFPVDTQLARLTGYTDALFTMVLDRLRGVSSTTTANQGPTLSTSSTAAENTFSYTSLNWGNTGFANPNYISGNNAIYWNFRRAPGFFDEVCYTGTGSATTQAHNLGVAPELNIIKRRSSAGQNWIIAIGNTGNALNFNTDPQFTFSGYSGSSTAFTVPASVSASSETYVAYLFATCPGVSKVGSYTGTGAAQNIDCGFAAGARFVLIKRTDSTGDWYTYDSARGISSSSDPYLLLNSTAVEVTGTNYVDTFASGFTLTASAPAGLNANGGSYIFLAIA